jgi:Fic family protein
VQQVEEWSDKQTPLTEALIRKLHAIIFTGPRARPTPYRDGQNVIRDVATGEIIYMPPEAADVPGMMSDLVVWIARAERESLPAPVIAAFAHYQFVTIHPFYDGNGRTARALATLILYRHGYDLGRFYSLEETYAQDLPAYYAALRTHPHHNYYEGRAHADLTSWLAYFTRSMAEVFNRVAEEVRAYAGKPVAPEPLQLRRLDRRARLVLGLFTRKETVTAAEIARTLGLSPRTIRDLVAEWLTAGWLEIDDPSRKGRRYRLSADYRRIIGGLSAD